MEVLSGCPSCVARRRGPALRLSAEVKLQVFKIRFSIDHFPHLNGVQRPGGVEGWGGKVQQRRSLTRRPSAPPQHGISRARERTGEERSRNEGGRGRKREEL